MTRFYCRTCKVVVHSDASVPTGWYGLTRMTDHQVRLGLFCSLRCLRAFEPVDARTT